MNEQQVVKLLQDPEAFVREIATEVMAVQQGETPKLEGYMSVKSAARYLDVPEGTIRKWLQRGQLTRYKVRGSVRVRIAELVKQE